MADNNEMSTALATKAEDAVGIYESTESYANAWKIAINLSKSQLVPKNFQGRPEDCIIALDLAQRMKASPFAILQNMYIVQSKPSFSAQFLIACINQSKRFSPLMFKEIGEKGTPSWGCVCYAKTKDGEVVQSPEVTMAMAQAEGWVSKPGSKWKTMPELMLHYRTATMFARLYAPDIVMGMITTDEAEDIAASEEYKKEKSKHSLSDSVASVAEEAVSNEPEKTDEEKVADAIMDTSCPVSVDDIKAYCERNGQMFVADLIIPNLNRIAEAILAEGGAK